MHLTRFALSNCKCFNAEVELILKAGVNLIVGRNNSGKSALLQAMTTPCSNPHRSFRENGEVNGTGSGDGELVFSVTASELAGLQQPTQARQTVNVPAVPLPNINTPFATMIHYAGNDEPSLLRFAKWLKAAKLQVSVSVSNSYVRLWAEGGYTSNGAQSWWDLNHALMENPTGGFFQAHPSYLTNIGAALKGKLHLIPAVRANTLPGALGAKTNKLAPEGSNTVALLDTMQGNASKMKRFIKLVHEVLPAVSHLSVRKHQSNPNQGDVAVWEHDASTELDDLAPSLDQSGIGVRHILIFLLTCFVEKDPLVILIDEFEHSLHPGAIRELLEIFETEFPLHQFVIGTHSPTAIASARLSTISVVTKTTANQPSSPLKAQNFSDESNCLPRSEHPFQTSSGRTPYSGWKGQPRKHPSRASSRSSPSQSSVAPWSLKGCCTRATSMAGTQTNSSRYTRN